MAVDEIRALKDKKKESIKTAEMTDEERRRARANMPIMVQHIGVGEYVLVGATRDDVENNPDLMKRFDRAIAKDRQERGDHALLGAS